MWSLLGFLGIGAYVVGKDAKQKRDARKRLEEVDKDLFVQRDFVLEDDIKDVESRVDDEYNKQYGGIDACQVVHNNGYKKIAQWTERWEDELKAVRRDWGWDELTGKPCDPPENWKDILDGIDINIDCRFDPTVYTLLCVTRYKMLVMVSNSLREFYETWAIQGGRWQPVYRGMEAYSGFFKIRFPT